MAAAPAPLEVEVTPPWPYRLPSSGGGDRVMRVREGICERMLHVDGAPVRVRAWHPDGARVRLRADPVDPRLVVHAIAAGEPRDAAADDLAIAVERMRFALAVDDDYAAFYAMVKSDPVLGPAVRRVPHSRVGRRPWPWEALAWAIVNQLIQASRAAEIHRRFVRRWGPQAQLEPAAPPRGRRRGPDPLRDVPSAAVMAGRAPAELVALDLAEGRSIAMVRCAREVAAGRVDLFDPASDRRLTEIREIGPWTVQCLGQAGRGDPDSLPAGDLAYIKLVGHLAGLGRRATVEEVEEYFAPYAPYRGLAGAFALRAYGKKLTSGTQFPFDARAAMRRDLDLAA